MFQAKPSAKEGGHGLIAVAIDKDKGSQYALKWAVDNLLGKGQTVTLIHVAIKSQSIPNPMGSSVSLTDVSEDVAAAYREQLEAQNRELFLPFRCFCTRKDIHCNDVILEDTDVARAIIEYVSHTAVETLVVGATSRNTFLRRFKTVDIPTSLCRGVPDFCNVFVISKGKITSTRSAARPAPPTPRINSYNISNHKPDPSDALIRHLPKAEASPRLSLPEDHESIKSPFTRATKSASNFREMTAIHEADISFVSSSRSSTDRMSISDPYDSSRTTRLSIGSDMMDRSFESVRSPFRGSDVSFGADNPNISQESSNSWSSQNTEDMEAEMRRLKLELKQTMDLYSTACKEALFAKQKAKELHRWKIEEEQRLEEARLAEEAALAIAEKEKAKCRAAVEAAEAAKRIAELEGQKRINAEMKAVKEAEEKKKALDRLANRDVRCRRYSIEEIEAATEFFTESRKIGEGGYGPVYRCYLDHTPVAIKVLRPDAAQGRSQFQQEVEVLSCIRHPNMVLLLGACPEYGCLVYEYMANGSLEDRLFRRGNTPVLSWQLRFRIAAEIGTALLFLHQTKPEPLVHRDLKPANILLDRNYVSKISDVGLARLVPPTVADSVTQYRMTSAAGTFCYIDPEYQQTGMLGVKSDIYSLGIMLLQIITAKSPMGLSHHVERAIEKGTFPELLDPAVTDWPVEEALCFAKMALLCSELRRKDRPDLGTVVLPELNRLRALADEALSQNQMFQLGFGGSPSSSHVFSSSTQDVLSESRSGYESRSSASSGPTGRRQSLS